MTIFLVIVIVVLWLLLGHITRFTFAMVTGGYQVPLGRRIYCYALAPVAAFCFMFDGILWRRS